MTTAPVPSDVIFAILPASAVRSAAVIATTFSSLDFTITLPILISALSVNSPAVFLVIVKLSIVPISSFAANFFIFPFDVLSPFNK